MSIAEIGSADMELSSVHIPSKFFRLHAGITIPASEKESYFRGPSFTCSVDVARNYEGWNFHIQVRCLVCKMYHLLNMAY